MTPEEAAEEILGGKPYATCTRCGGSGWHKAPVDLTRITTTRITAEALRDYCKGCDGSGQWLRGDYATACRILGKDPPPPPRRAMLLKPWPEFNEKLKQFGASMRDSYFDEIQIVPSNDFQIEYLTHWRDQPEEPNDTLDAMKYAQSHCPPSPSKKPPR